MLLFLLVLLKNEEHKYPRDIHSEGSGGAGSEREGQEVRGRGRK